MLLSQIEWLLDGKPLEYANRIMEVFEFGYAALDISAVYPRDTGKTRMLRYYEINSFVSQ